MIASPPPPRRDSASAERFDRSDALDHVASPHPTHRAAYRRLAVTILGLDVATLARELGPALSAQAA